MLMQTVPTLMVLINVLVRTDTLGMDSHAKVQQISVKQLLALGGILMT